MDTITSTSRNRSSYFLGCMSPSCVPVDEQYTRIKSGSRRDRQTKKWRKLMNKVVEESKKSIYGSSEPVVFRYDAVSYAQNFDEGNHSADNLYVYGRRNSQVLRVDWVGDDMNTRDMKFVYRCIKGTNEASQANSSSQQDRSSNQDGYTADSKFLKKITYDCVDAKNKMKIITEEFVEPRMDSELRALWERNNDMLISWILNTIDGHIIYQLSNDIDHLNKKTVLLRINGERDQMKRLIQFLMGLDECYSNIRGQILLMQPLPTASKAYTMVRQEEKQREVNVVMTQDQATQDKSSTSGQTATPSEDHVSARMDQLQKQINQVLLMLQQNGPSHDSGVTDHICTALKLMHNIYKCKTPIIVNLPNGQTVKVITVGSVTINKYVTLDNVFYIPTFTYNILSDHSKRIAVGNLCDDLYFLNSPPKVSATTPTILHSSSKSLLWHSRLGHPSLTSHGIVHQTSCPHTPQQNARLPSKVINHKVPPDLNYLRVLGCRAYVHNHTPDKFAPRYKARLVAKGFNQKEGIDYTENFSPVAKMRKYALELLKCGNVLNDKPISTPLDPIQSLNLTDGEPLSDTSLYRNLVGKLIYLTITRPDISFATQLLSKFSQAPWTPHMKTLLRVLRHIKLCLG
nr:reverse transcriptase, RNA-dependent DNA polymerase, Gag-polypeptide of LTR copia-type [Tanacetum cinerariifolium]